MDYFPPNFDHFNAYAIHNQQIDGQEPIYKALYPSSEEEPDFHDLESFEVFSGLPTIQTTTTLSDVWSKALSLRTYTISNLWNGRDDTFSKADDKGGNQILVSLKGMILKTFYDIYEIERSNKRKYSHSFSTRHSMLNLLFTRLMLEIDIQH